MHFFLTAESAAVHNAAYEGWLEGAELLISLGAKVNASNNAGDTPWHWAQNMGHQDMMALLEKVGGCIFHWEPESRKSPAHRLARRPSIHLPSEHFITL